MFIRWLCLMTLVLVFTGSAVGAITMKKSTFKGLESIEIETKSLKVVVLPTRGANIISVFDKRNMREWIWQNKTYSYKNLPYAAGFPDGDMSGFDDCFPTVGVCEYPDGPWKGTTMADHGETWTLPFEVTRKGSSVRFRTYGIRLPYVFEKEITLTDPDTVTIRYKATNQTSEAMKAAWAAHALIKVSPGMEIFLPGKTEIREGIPGWTVESKNNLDWIKLTETQNATKRFTEKLPFGYGGFYDSKTGDYLAMMFSNKDLPYIGIWINQAAYPAGSDAYNAALEPTNADETYQLSEARGIDNIIPAKSSVKWVLNIVLGQSDRKDLHNILRNK